MTFTFIFFQLNQGLFERFHATPNMIIIYYHYGYFLVQVQLFLHTNEIVSYFFNHYFKSIMNLERIYNDFICMIDQFH